MNGDKALIWTINALCILALFTRDKEQSFPGQGVSASYTFMLTCVDKAKEEGSPCVTEDMAIKVGERYGWTRVPR